MPPIKRGEPPAPLTTYRSSGAAPKQQHFPGRKRSARTYGKSVSRSLKQETLTQMDFVGTPSASAYELLDDSQDDEVDMIELEPLPALKQRRSRTPQVVEKKARSSRRKSAGETLVPTETKPDSKRRGTMGDTPPSGTASSSFHTQTLTQLLSNHDPEEVDGHDWHVTDSEAGGDAVFILETPQKNKEAETCPAPEPSHAGPPGNEAAKPATPAGRQKKIEIPSSHSPALTPMLLRYSPAGRRESPLKRKSSPLRPLGTPILKSARKTPRLVVEDTFEPSLGSSQATPTRQSAVTTPKANTGKRLRFDFDVDKENITPGRKKPKSPKVPRETLGRKPLREVPDSDEELDDTTDDADSIAEIDVGRAARDETPCPVGDQDSDATAEPDSCYGDLGAETQAQLLLSETTQPSQGMDKQESHPNSQAKRSAPVRKPRSRASQRTQRGDDKTQRSDSLMPVRGSNSSPVTKQTQFTPYTQGMESQRLPLDDIRALGPQTDRSDIMVSLHPEPLRQIVEGTKDHEFRAWKIPSEVSRVWLYATNPHSELRYMCILGSAKLPGEIANEKGVGNTEFNSGKKKFANYAYEFLQIYELNNPVPLAEMIRKGWIKGAPQKYAFIPPAVVGELTANLRCALFGGGDDDGEQETQYPDFPRSSPQLTESQELKAQLNSEGQYSTQILPSVYNSHDAADAGNDEDIFAKPAVPATDGDEINNMNESDMQTPRPSRRSRYAAAGAGGSSVVRTSQATTISQLSSSPGGSPEKFSQGNDRMMVPATATPSQRRSTRRRNIGKHVGNSQHVNADTPTAAPPPPFVESIGSSSPILPHQRSGQQAPRGGNNGEDDRDSQETTVDAEEPESGGGGGDGEHTMSYPSSSSAVNLYSSTDQLPLQLPDSLLNDDNDGPPPIIWDSADEHSD
ncbi:hypothetical protein MN608_00768 [Microdochium nivale]|nr:hypothetical protein MN608_00768 [Microdochium nivale]